MDSNDYIGNLSQANLEVLGQFTQQISDSYKSSTNAIVSRIAYLIGVPFSIFEFERSLFDIDLFSDLENDKNARIIRNLCIMRTTIERNFSKINNIMNNEHKGLMSIPEYVPTDTLSQLSHDGIQFKTNQRLNQYIIDLNTNISNRINNVKEHFPIWLNWNYIRNLFIMPNGLTEAGIREAANEYYTYTNYYPFQMYMNWPPSDQGNILYNDKKFVTLLYHWNHDDFTDFSKVSDASNQTKNSIYDFIETSNKTVFVVDCENSDPYKLCATIKNLDSAYLEKITKIILYDDVNAASAWRILESYIDIPIEYILINRVNQYKSLVDVKLTAGTCKEYYQNNVDSFVLVSSDSDYWGLIESIPTARFLVMFEYEKTGISIRNALLDSNIFYCYIDNFYTGNSNDIKTSALLREIRDYLNQAISVNVNEMMERVYRLTRVNLSNVEKKQFYDKYVKPMYLEIDSDGNLVIQLKK